MERTRFDRLRTIRLEHESQTGRTEICQEPDGTRWIRLCVMSPDCQCELLNLLGEGVPVRLEDGALELLLPWHEGVPLRQWLYERTPTLGQRRDACLSLLEQQIEGKLPPCLTALAARPENLVMDHGAMRLQYLPSFKEWEPGMGEAAAVNAAAAVIREVLVPKLGQWSRERLPEELQLLDCRQKERGYAAWGQLQRDVDAIPDELPRIGQVWLPYVRRVQGWLARYGKYILRALAALLLTAALLSLTAAYRRWRNGKETVWQGMPQVGDQDLRSEEGRE